MEKCVSITPSARMALQQKNISELSTHKYVYSGKQYTVEFSTRWTIDLPEDVIDRLVAIGESLNIPLRYTYTDPVKRRSAMLSKTLDYIGQGVIIPCQE